ncbi:hypothetical protein TRFO_23498 [Tritrichomonas foetus]|uniref:Uncharacterized protein n=1 Tax=Tritrichomonas foetus TaxID=1144522 RepID=A0A1J4KAZ2_9EUKA|nr:hypothetical protein TRFO_23498 [Tritrichomonas foetus]|eukprot:OHT08130.1 hypothetical protein TRFO_23498 [Tritrichomonas foetus]
MLFLYYFCNLVSSSDEFLKIFQQNWTAELQSPDFGKGLNIAKKYRVSFTKVSKQSVEVHIYSLYTNIELNTTYRLNIVNSKILNFSDKILSTQVYFDQKIGNFYSSTGKFGKLIFHIFIKPTNSIQISLIDKSANRIVSVHMYRDAIEYHFPWYLKHGKFIILGLIYSVAQFLSVWNQYRMMIAQKRHAVKRRALYKQNEMAEIEEAKKMAENLRNT